MLGKIITFIAVYYLVRFVMNLFSAPPAQQQRPMQDNTFAPPQPKSPQHNANSDDYIEYEEIK
jgi:hypothetical protein